MLDDALLGYQHFLTSVQQQHTPEQVIAAFGEYQLLCALREGPLASAASTKGLSNCLRKSAKSPARRIHAGTKVGQ